MTTIIVPVDGSRLSHAALPVAKWMADGLDARIVLLTVGAPPETAEQQEEERRRLRANLDVAQQELNGIDVERRTEQSRDPVNGILHAVRDTGADLVVMSTHGHSAIAELIEGSVAEEVVRAGVVPVTLVRPPGPER